ncbi:MAG: hypothetical protein J5775_05405 [Spirochaetales bacterium]|nr:hypothetical protein [Spirochaetales bacterium]
MKKALMSIIWAIVVMALVVSCATKAAAPEAEKAPAAVEVEKKAETPAPAKEEAPAAAKAVALEMNGTKTEYATIEEAIAAVPAGAEATVIISGDISVKKASLIKDATVTITDNGTAVTVTDAVNDGDGIQYMFKVEGEGKLIVSPKGGITFKGADPATSSVTRVMFLVGTGYKEPDQMSGYLEINPGVTVTGVISTSFGGIVRGYGKVIINGGVYTASANNKGNGLITLYSYAEINGGEFYGNDSVTVGLIMVTVECQLTINGGSFRDNAGTTSGLMKVNSKATCTINGGEFLRNKGYNDGVGAIDTTGTVIINGGVFAENVSADVVVAESGKLTKADSVALNVK